MTTPTFTWRTFGEEHAGPGFCSAEVWIPEAIDKLGRICGARAWIEPQDDGSYEVHTVALRNGVRYQSVNRYGDMVYPANGSRPSRPNPILSQEAARTLAEEKLTLMVKAINKKFVRKG